MIAPHAILGFLLLVLAVGNGHGRIVSYEGTSFPEEQGWERSVFCAPERWLDGGWLFQHVDECVEHPPPGGDRESYNRELDDFAGEQRFFIEWRMITTGDRSEILGTAPASLAAGGFGRVNYVFTIANDRVRFVRDNRLPILFVDIEPDIPHTFRLELFGPDLYVWYIDGQMIDDGLPEGTFPTRDTLINFRARSHLIESTTRWDYVRYGTIPKDASGDYDSDKDVDLTDYYYVHECLSNSGPGVDAGPGCRFADFDDDSDVDLKDLAEFQNRFTGEGG